MRCGRRGQGAQMVAGPPCVSRCRPGWPSEGSVCPAAHGSDRCRFAGRARRGVPARRGGVAQGRAGGGRALRGGAGPADGRTGRRVRRAVAAESALAALGSHCPASSMTGARAPCLRTLLRWLSRPGRGCGLPVCRACWCLQRTEFRPGDHRAIWRELDPWIRRVQGCGHQPDPACPRREPAADPAGPPAGTGDPGLSRTATAVEDDQLSGHRATVHSTHASRLTISALWQKAECQGWLLSWRV